MIHIVSRGLLLIICIVVAVECQGGRGGGGGGGGGGGRGGGGRPFHGGTGSSCKGDNCPSALTIWLSIIGGIVGLGLLIFGVSYFVKRWNGRPAQANVAFIKDETNKNSKQEKSDTSVFKSGYWNSRYFQYGKWHGPYRFSLTYDSQSMKVTGSGSDDIGKFIIDGIYSVETSRIALTKKYQAGTGNLSENLGHQVTIQLVWNAQNNQFEGKWYVQTSKYHGEDKFELKFNGQHLLTVYEKV